MEEQLSIVTDLLVNHKALLDEVAELVPGWLHLNNTKDFGLIYISKKMERDLKIPSEAALERGVEYLYENIHPETSKRVIPQLHELVKQDDPKRIISFYQLIRLPGEEYQWYFTSTKLYKEMNCTISITNPLNILNDFRKRVEKILNDNLFFKTNLYKYDQLTHREKDVIIELVKGKTQKEIAKKFSLSEFTIKTHRQNIYRKLKISNIVELIKFADKFDLS